MRSGILTLAFVIVVGVIIANALANSAGTKVVLDSLGKLWATSINGLLARPSNN